MKKVLLPIGIRRDLALLKRVMGSLLEQWLDADDDITEYLSRHYPDPKSFDDLTTHLSIWINAMELEQRDISKDFIEEISKIPNEGRIEILDISTVTVKDGRAAFIDEEDDYISKNKRAFLVEMDKEKSDSIYDKPDVPGETKHIPDPDSEVAHAMTEKHRATQHEPYTDQDYIDIACNMETYGGSFFKFIGSALFKADQENKRKLANAFPEEFDKYFNFK